MVLQSIWVMNGQQHACFQGGQHGCPQGFPVVPDQGPMANRKRLQG